MTQSRIIILSCLALLFGQLLTLAHAHEAHGTDHGNHIHAKLPAFGSLFTPEDEPDTPVPTACDLCIVASVQDESDNGGTDDTASTDGDLVSLTAASHVRPADTPQPLRTVVAEPRERLLPRRSPRTPRAPPQ